ncbi:MAG TPA: hypothetical protein VNX68_03710, partial [Nitrosopumilaceae archaeon]|nr:hypothetical protein [Nitrosopumilaceae archaeon]
MSNLPIISIYSKFCCIFILLNIFGCQKYLQIPTPPNKLDSTGVFNSDPSATSAITGIYSRMSESAGFASGGLTSVTELCGL